MYIKHIQTHVSRIHVNYTLTRREVEKEGRGVGDKIEIRRGVERKRETHTVLRIQRHDAGMPQCWCVTTPAVILLALSCHMYVVTCDENWRKFETYAG